MFNIGFFEILIIFTVALFAIGPEKLPETAKAIAKMVAEIAKIKENLKNAVFSPSDEAEIRAIFNKTNEKKETERE